MGFSPRTRCMSHLPWARSRVFIENRPSVGRKSKPTYGRSYTVGRIPWYCAGLSSIICGFCRLACPSRMRRTVHGVAYGRDSPSGRSGSLAARAENVSISPFAAARRNRHTQAALSIDDGGGRPSWRRMTMRETTRAMQAQPGFRRSLDDGELPDDFHGRPGAQDMGPPPDQGADAEGTSFAGGKVPLLPAERMDSTMRRRPLPAARETSADDGVPPLSGDDGGAAPHLARRLHQDYTGLDVAPVYRWVPGGLASDSTQPGSFIGHESLHPLSYETMRVPRATYEARCHQRMDTHF